MLKNWNGFRNGLAAGGVVLSALMYTACTSGGSHQSTADQETTDQVAQEDFEAIFDGVSLSGWRGDTALWRVEDQAIVGEIRPGKEIDKNSFIIWEGGRPADFELIAEFRLIGEGNSGVNYRSEEVPDVPFALRGYQADIDAANTYTGQNYEERGRTILAFPGQQMRLPPVDGEIGDHAKGNVWTAGIQTDSLGNRDSLKAQIKKGDWNEIRIVAKGNRLQHYINGTLMSEVVDDDEKNRKSEGLLGFQVHVGPPMTIAYRNIRLKTL
ncbi:3-keto-disaccharide hydrolase [Parapedobacter sp. DT-150]|uniref:3-keto-disaccharide hydrolase n=1 Tax=Parapedobacter sp. DT-150 TaxID=3396162 RepID=UPI003F1C2357